MIGRLVSNIRKATSADEAVETYKADALEKGLDENWIRSVFKKTRELPVLDGSFDVHSHGVSVLTQIGVAEETQTQMWQVWPTLPEDVRAAWVEDFKLLDTSDPTDVASYAMLLVDLLTP